MGPRWQLSSNLHLGSELGVYTQLPPMGWTHHLFLPLVIRTKPDDDPMMTRSRSGHHRVIIGFTLEDARPTQR